MKAKQAQAFRTLDTWKPAELTVHVTLNGFEWGLWQLIGRHKTPIGFWLQLWKGAEEYCSLLNKQFCATYVALLDTEPLPEKYQ